ncbi:MAG: YdcF family protein [Anaerolineales bacterium]|nr:YdcF family protein [Anaerolineales bacterium]
MPNKSKSNRKIARSVFIATLGIVSLPIVWNLWVEWRFKQDIYSIKEVQPDRVAIVFGARIYDDGRLSAMLSDRVETAVQLYQAGKVEKLLMSGDNRFASYDEPGRMMEYAISRGVPAEDIQPDYAGRRTYDTCYRAKEIFGLDSAILVTQSFHLPRALFTCNQLGVQSVGVSSDLQPYSRRSLVWSTIREKLAVVVALIDVIIKTPPQVLGDPIPID